MDERILKWLFDIKACIEEIDDFFNEEDLREDPNHSPIFSGIFGFNTGFQSKKTGSEGIQHRESFKFPEANNIQLTVHTGKEDQEVDQTLLSLASDGYFLVQQNYYKNDASQYWTGNHRLLDTAYVVSKDTISPRKLSGLISKNRNAIFMAC